ncbi:ATP-dependent DNA helicase Snf21 [Basidiobolus ranarum]|uniref:ATP-dependent DNA helicase Snf21 n=1 Tax=Basidiobolus ranarum TaxID=34480 RepID=A0ABR2X2I0_9FUNG
MNPTSPPHVSQKPSERSFSQNPTMTSEKLRAIIMKIKSLKEMGATEATNAEYAQLMQIIRFHSKMQQNCQNPIVNQSTPTLGMQQELSAQNLIRLNKVAEASPQLLTPQLPSTQLMNDPQSGDQLSEHTVPSTSQIASSKVPVPPSSPVVPINLPKTPPIFSQEQLTALKYQIYAYKLLSKNLPLPDNLRKVLFVNMKKESDPKDVNVQEAAIDVETKSSKMEEKILNALDSFSVLKIRQDKIRNRIQYRINELESLPSNLSNECFGRLRGDMLQEKSTLNGANANSKIKALIELKALRLLERQKKLRGEIMDGMKKTTTLETSADRSAFKRTKKQAFREARVMEKLELQQRIDRERREKQSHYNRLQSIITHGRELLQWHRTQQAKQTRLGRAVLQYHSYAEREEQKRIERVSKERLKALKADDEEAYLKLIDQTKDTRITHLLKQTDSYLGDLAMAVQIQQSDTLHYDPSTRGGEELMDQISDEETDVSKIDYFAIAHKIHEEVEQPSILIGGKLKEYQIKGLQWMVSLYNNRLNGILADEMGLGKTIQTLSLITYLIEKKHQNGPFLIIVPLSTLTNWTLEFEKWAPSVVKVVYKGPPNERREIQQMQIKHGNFQVLLTTFEYIIKDKHILGKIKWVHMIIDEGHRMKNVNSKLTYTLTQYYSTRYRLILTGTPLQNNLPELWALLNFVLPKIFNSVKSFDEWFNTPFANAGGQDKIELNEEEALLIIRRLHKVLRPFLLRRLKKDVESELPDKVETVVKCKLSALQTKLYNQMRKHGMLFTTDDEKGATGIRGLNNTIMQLRKICNHPFVFEDVERAINPSRTNDECLYRVSGKFELLDRILPKYFATGHRILMFFQMTTIMSIMEDFLVYKGIEYLRLDGTVKSDDRSLLLKQFNAPDSPYKMFLLSTRAGGLGLNLQTADTVIIFDSDWNPHQDLQAQDRAHRIGQTKEVRILRLISENSVEETILARAQYKLDMDGKVIQAGKFDNKSTAEEREAFLRTLLEVDNSNESDMDEELNDDDLNEIIARSDEELAIFKQMDKDRELEAEKAWKRSGGRGKKPERLIQEHELPDIYMRDHEEDLRKQEEDDGHRGRGHRSKGEIHYDDGLTEEQWLEAIEDDNLDVDEVIAKKKERRRRREERKKNKSSKEEVDTPEPKSSKRVQLQEDIDDTASVASSETPRRGRSKKKTAETPTPTPARKKRRVAKEKDAGLSDTPSQVKRNLDHLFQELYSAVEDCVDPEEDNRQRCLLFLELPSKKMYPQYYTMIKQPIAMDIIRKRMKTSYYKNVNQIREDFHLMFNNARTFNEEGSWVYVDADKMQEAFDAKFEELFPGGHIPAALTEAPEDSVSIASESSTRKNSDRAGSEETISLGSIKGKKLRTKALRSSPRIDASKQSRRRPLLDEDSEIE